MKIFTIASVEEGECGEEYTIPFAYAMTKERAEKVVEENMAERIKSLILNDMLDKKMREWHNKNKIETLPSFYDTLDDIEKIIFNSPDHTLSNSDLNNKKIYRKQHDYICKKNMEIANKYNKERQEFYNSTVEELKSMNIFTAYNMKLILDNKKYSKLIDEERNNYVISEVEVLE